ncbi:MAG: asparaginase [Paracoccaceae bacterium]|nr:asparaginase [Paracoccaceae bacterium]
MTNVVPMVEVWRGEFLESLHCGAAVVCNDRGEIIQNWGNFGSLILPRSSCKMIQALPLITSGAADAFGLAPQHLALACASHNAAKIHTDTVQAWLSDLDLGENNLLCGVQMPRDRAVKEALLADRQEPCQIHNNCSGKHAGFLTLNRHLGGHAEYINSSHPVQRACLEAFELTTDETSAGFAIDGCSAPNFVCSLYGLARAMAWFAAAGDRSDLASKAAVSLFEAMIAHPDLVAGEGRACTELMRAMEGRAAIKTGAEGVFVAILPKQRLGVALKMNDGATRASQAVIAAILVHLKVLASDHPATKKFVNMPQYNWRGIETGTIRISPQFLPEQARS